ncbi:type IV secretion system protein [Hydrogenimonas sp. SS33]|uniref:type IV secretion system protein n=1 Tax=Hydrogenimonas leucolamina TaxID=2954236 RepID=UPI00336C2B0F
MKKILILLFLATAATYAASSTIMPSDVIRLVKTPIEHWHGQFVNISWSVFRYLMFFEVILLFSMKFLKGDFEFGSVMGDLIRIVLIFGFFSWLIYATYDLSKILQGYTWMAHQVGGGVDVDEAFKKIVNMVIKLWKKASIWKPGEAILLSLIILVSAGVFFILLGQIIKNYIFSIISLYGSSLFFAFGAFSQTRQYAINAFVNIFRYGAKYLFMLLVVDLGLIILGNALSSDAKIKDLAMTLFAVIVIKEIAEGVEGFVDGIFSGMGSSGGSVITGYMQRSASTVQQAAVGAASGMAKGAAGGGFAAAKAAAAAGEGGGRMANIGRAAGAGLAGSIGGAITGAAKGATGRAGQGTGQLSGIGTSKVAGGVAKAGFNVAKGAVKMATGGSTSGKSVSSTKDRNGFDTSLLKSESGSSTGEIKQA